MKKPKPLRVRLLTVIVAVSFAAIAFCVISFVLMLGGIQSESRARGKTENDELITLVMDGIAQNEGNTMYFMLRPLVLALENQTFINDEELLHAATGEFARVLGEEYYQPCALFITRSGEITAAAYSDEWELPARDETRDIRVEEVYQMLEDADLLSKFYTEGEQLTWNDIFSEPDPAGVSYNLDNSEIPALMLAQVSPEVRIGLFVPSSSSLGIYKALHETAELAQAETAAAIDKTAATYLLLLIAVGVVLMGAIALTARRLSLAIAMPEEREKEALERVSRLKSEFLADISHELKTPLAVMSSHAQQGQRVLESGIQPQSVQHSMQLIASEADRLALMVSQVLDITQIDEGRMRLDLRKNAIFSIIQNTMDTYYPVFSKNNNTLRVEPCGLPPVFCDANRVMQVLVNLIANASRHTRDGSIVIRAWRESEWVWVSVADTGAGIPPEVFATLFERYRAKKAPGDTGTGLGLYISKHIIEVGHGGTLRVVSEIGAGTTVSFSLPVAEAGDS